MIRAFFFDFNQTLVRCPAWMDLETRAFSRAALTSLADQRLIAPPAETELAGAESLFWARRRAADRSGRESSHFDDLQAILRRLGLLESVPRPALEATVEGLHRACLASAELVPGAGQTLPALRQLGLRLGIVSNAAFAPFLSWALEGFGLADLFEAWLVSAEVGVRKPRRQIFEVAMERMGVTADEAAHVGDDFNKDIRAAKRLGLRAVWLRPSADPPSGSQVDLPDAIVPSLNPLAAWAAEWRRAADTEGS